MKEKNPKDNPINCIKTSSKKEDNKSIETNQDADRETKIGNYIIKKTLGRGTFAKVKLAIHLPKREKVAIKIIEKKRLKEEDDLIRLKREFEMLTQFNHPNVISVSEIFESKEAFYTVMDYCDGGELFNYIVINKILSEEKSAFFYFQLVNGLEYIHSLGIVHRDLKPENLLLTSDFILKISDFGLSNYFNKNGHELLETPCGSPCYASPEMLSGDNYDGFKIDIWATGIILFAMLCGYLPFDHKDNDKLFKKILQCKITYPDFISKEAKNLIKKILVPDPRKRITIPEIKKHPFYLKGKEIFDRNFTVFLETSNNSSNRGEEIYIDSSFDEDNKNFWYEFRHKSQILFIDIPGFSEKNFFVNNLRSRSFEKNEMPNFNIKMLMNPKKEKTKKGKKNLIKDLQKEKLRLENEIENIQIITYHNSTNYLIKDIRELCEKIINNHQSKNKSNKQYKFDRKKLLQKKFKYNNNPINTDVKNNSNIKNIDVYNDEYKEEKKDLKQRDNIDIKKYIKTESSRKKLKNSNNFIKQKITIQKHNNEHKMKLMNTKIKVNKKLATPFKLIFNDLLVKHKKIVKTNKLPKNVKLKSDDAKTKRATSNQKISKLKNILNIINHQSIKPNINIINKQNIIHHFTTNITNYTKKDYYSNIIVNNLKHREPNKKCSISQGKNKKLNNYLEKNKEQSIIKEYLKNINIGSLDNILAKNNEKKLKSKKSLNKELIKDNNIYKNINKQYIQLKNTTNIMSPGSLVENIKEANLTFRGKKSNNQLNDIRIKIYTNTFHKYKNRSKNINSNTNGFNLINNKKLHNKNKRSDFSSSKDDLTFEYSLRSPNYLEVTGNYAKTKQHFNPILYMDNSVENAYNTFYGKKNIEKISKPKFSNKVNKLNNFSIDNNMFNYTDRRGNFNYMWKKLEKLKKNDLFKKQIINNNSKKLNLIEILKTDTFSNKGNKVQMNYRQEIQTQRNNPSKLTISQNSKNLKNYLNTNRNNEILIENKKNTISNNVEKNNIGNIKSNQILPSYIKKINNINDNNLRNRDYFMNINRKINSLNLNNNNLFNNTCDNIKINIDSKKQNIFNKANKENTHNKYFTILDENDNSNSKKVNKLNYNTIINSKHLDSNRTKEKKINVNLNKIMNNNYTYTYDINKSKINSKFVSLKNKKNESSNLNNKNILEEYFKNKQISINNNNSIEKKNVDNSQFNRNTLIETKKNYKNYKNINNKSLNLNKLNNNMNYLSLKSHNYNISNTDGNTNNEINNKKINPFENMKPKKIIRLKTSNNNPNKENIRFSMLKYYAKNSN